MHIVAGAISCSVLISSTHRDTCTNTYIYYIIYIWYVYIKNIWAHTYIYICIYIYSYSHIHTHTKICSSYGYTRRHRMARDGTLCRMATSSSIWKHVSKFQPARLVVMDRYVKHADYVNIVLQCTMHHSTRDTSNYQQRIEIGDSRLLTALHGTLYYTLRRPSQNPTPQTLNP